LYFAFSAASVGALNFIFPHQQPPKPISQAKADPHAGHFCDRLMVGNDLISFGIFIGRHRHSSTEPGNDLFADLLRGQPLFLQIVRHQDLVHTDRAVGCMIVNIAAVQTLVPEAAIAVAVARQLRDQLWNFADSAIGFASLTGEVLGLKRRRQTNPGRFGFVVRRN
jgi:hypothetical protein